MGIQREQVIQAALQLLDTHGIEGVTMRKLAQTLDIQAPSLYWHFASKQALVDGMADALFEDVARQAVHELPWKQSLYQVAGEIRSALRARRDGARVFAGTYVVTDNVLRAGDAMIAALLRAGAEDKIAAWGSFSILYYVLGFVMEEQALATGPALVSEDRREAFLELALQRYPSTWKVRDALFDQDFDQRFSVGIELLIDGIDVRLHRTGRSTLATSRRTEN